MLLDIVDYLRVIDAEMGHIDYVFFNGLLNRQKQLKWIKGHTLYAYNDQIIRYAMHIMHNIYMIYYIEDHDFYAMHIAAICIA